MRLTIDKSIKEIPYYPKAALYGGDSGWVRLSSNENPNGPSPRAVESIVESVSSLNRYPESEFELKSALAAKYALKPENIIIGNGSNEIIETSFRALRYEGKDEAPPPCAFLRFLRDCCENIRLPAKDRSPAGFKDRAGSNGGPDW